MNEETHVAAGDEHERSGELHKLANSNTFQPLQMENYEWTIEKDAELGYRPRLDHIDGPVPFVFLSHSQVAIIRLMDELGETCIYKCKRPKNSFDIHQSNFATGSIYDILDPSFKILTDKAVQDIINNKTKRQYSISTIPLQIENISKLGSTVKQSDVIVNDDTRSCTPAGFDFDSCFEGGNLDLVFKTRENDYNLVTRCDTNSKGHTQGFYFKVKSNCSSEAKLNIINMTKPRSLFAIKGYPFYAYKDPEGNLKWQQMDSSCKMTYTRTASKYKLNDNQKHKVYLTLSFKVNLDAGQERWFAYSIPYSYSNLLSYLNRLSCDSMRVKQATPENSEEVKPHNRGRKETLVFKNWESSKLRIEVLCKSESLLDVPLLTLTDFDVKPSELTRIEMRPIVYVVSRVHPSESVSSYSVEGLINRLLDDSPSSKALLSLLIFKIVPMINPDGVIVGNFRTNLSGDDLNRRYDTPSKAFHPTVDYR